MRHGSLSCRMCERVVQVVTVFTSSMTRRGRSHGVNSHLQTVMCCSLASTETGRLNIMTQDTARLNAIRNPFLFGQSTEDHSIHQTWHRLGASQKKRRPSRDLGSAPCAKGHRHGEDRFQLLSGLQRAEVASGGK